MDTTGSPYPFLEAIGTEMGAVPGQLLEAVLGPSTQDGDHPFHRLERGKIPLQQARDDILCRGQVLYNLEVDIFQLFPQLPRGVERGLQRALFQKGGGRKSCSRPGSNTGLRSPTLAGNGRPRPAG